MSGIPFWSTVTRRDTPPSGEVQSCGASRKGWIWVSRYAYLSRTPPESGVIVRKSFFHDSLILNSTKLFMLLTSIIADLRG